MFEVMLLPSDESPALLLAQQGKYELTSHILPWLNVSAWKILCILILTDYNKLITSNLTLPLDSYNCTEFKYMWFYRPIWKSYHYKSRLLNTPAFFSISTDIFIILNLSNLHSDTF